VLGAVIVLVVVLASLKSLATLYTDSLWFSSVDLHRVWSTLLGIKVGLFASFGAVFFVLLWVNLLICDRLGASVPASDPEDELVRRYQHSVRPYSGRVHAAVAVVLALIAASGTVGEWDNWILFTHAQRFGVKDPQFGLDAGFYVFKLPFLEFLVNWFLVVLVVVLLVTAAFHYLNGGIRAQRTPPRVRPAVKVHLSVLLALVALVKAVGYVLQRYQLDTSTNGYVEGAGYTDVHARLPALELLFFVSLFSAAILLYNIRRQGWTLPVLAVGVWAFVALVIGVIYPAVLQALKVNPAQSTLEQPYIKRNIAATRAAYTLDHVVVSTFKGKTSVTPTEVSSSMTTLDNIRLWDPDPSISLPTFQKLQDLKSYYTFQSVAVDRYTVDGKVRPTVVGVRQMNPTDLPSAGWVNTHLEYTHGEGMALAAANEANSDGQPVFSIKDVPPVSSNGLPTITQAGVYFGLNDPGYVIADSRQPELDYPTGNGTDHTSHYQGTGGVKLDNFLTKAAFAVRLGDLNILISNLITPQSKMMFVRTVMAMAQKAAPFLSYDADPYPALVDGHIDWILNAYTTTDEYPYSQNADTQQIPPGSGLPSSYNYVRNSVDVVIDAYSGKMTFYAMDDDPILRSYEAAFPGMFIPKAQMSPQLRAHLRYPEDLFSAQAAIYGRYHISSPSNFYTAGNAWSLSPTAGAGSPTNALAVTVTTNAQGAVTGGSLQRMSPLYQELQQPGVPGQSFTISDAYVPAAQGSSIQNLSAFMMASSDPGQFGKLRVYVTQPGHSVVGPALADSYIEENTTVSSHITFLDQHGSQVLLGNVLMVPIHQAMLYVRPLYTESTGNPEPQLRDVIAVFGQNVKMAPTLDAALSAVLGTSVGSSSPTTPATRTPTSGSSTPSSGSSVEQQAAADLAQAAQDYTAAEKALKTGTLGTYQKDVAAAQQEEAAAQKLLESVGSSSGTGSTTTTTTVPAGHSGTSKSKKGSSDGGSSTTSTTSPSSTSTTDGRGSSSTTVGSGSSGSGSSGSGSTSTTSGTVGTAPSSRVSTTTTAPPNEA
jgi:uncharacterized membrane protein (UPF0182 family)